MKTRAPALITDAGRVAPISAQNASSKPKLTTQVQSPSSQRKFKAQAHNASTQRKHTTQAHNASTNGGDASRVGDKKK